jgi:NitT/TauT family transport system substrate-binding protein
MKTKFLLVLSVILFLGACRPEAPPPDQVTVQLKWVHQAQFAGFYVANEQGFYANENLEVTFVPGGVGIDLLDPVRNDKAEFSVVSADSLIVEWFEGAPVTAIATTYRINPFVLVTFADSGIKSPYDLPGRIISLNKGSGDIQFMAMLQKLNLDLAAMQIVDFTYDYTPFLNGEIDVVNSFAAGSLLQLQDQVGEREINLIWPEDYGIAFYSDTIVAHNDLIASNPDLIYRFLKATLEGHRFALENPEEAIEATLQYAEQQDRDLQMNMLTASVPMIHTGKDQIGWMQPKVWESMHDILIDQNIIATPIDIHQVYTLEFLEQVYSDQ